jgi:hypothetical protein
VASPLVRWLAGRSPHDLAAILARRRDTLGGPHPPADLAALATRLQSRGSVAAALAALPRPAVQLIEMLRALGGPGVGRDRLAASIGRAPDDAELAATLEVLAQRALVWPEGNTLRMAGELWSAAIHPLDLGGPFQPRPPRLALADADPVAVARETAAAATTAVERATALLDAVDAAPVALLKPGGVGSRELRRLAKSVRSDEPEVRLWLELAYAAGLLGVSGGQVLPTEAYDDWCAAEPAARLPQLLRAWPHLPAAPLAERRPGGDPLPAALLRDATSLATADLRAALLRSLGDLPGGSGLADGGQVAAVLHWLVPLLAGPARQHPVLASLWREAQLVGAVAHGTLTPLGRALLDDPAGIEPVARQLLPSSVDEAVFQNDLTVVVPGMPAAALARLLDSAADRESRWGAATWRFSASSLRAALDAGHEPTGLVESLRAVAVGGALPQALEYLVADAGRRHGQIRVRAVRCVLRADDPALISEIVGVRALRPLALAVLAPTVLASAKPVAETLAALRAAGYAPVGEDADGQPRIERAARRRAPALRRAGRTSFGGGSGGGVATGHAGPARSDPVDLLATAERLLAAAVTNATAPWPPASQAPSTEPLPEGQLAKILPLRAPRTAAGTIPGKRSTPDAVRPGAGLGTTRGARSVAGFDAAPDPAEVARAVDRHAAHLDVTEQRLLRNAIIRGAGVKISYRNASGDFSTRVVEPIGLERHLLVAWCHLRDEERAFALDRIEAVSPA